MNRVPASLPGAVPLEAGDPAPPVGALDETGTPVFTHADLVTGRPLVLLFCPADGDSLQETLIAFRDRGADFAGLDALLF
ncbi:MAG: hypothetical protein ACREFM_21005, partial [Hypericibacter sp.]